MTWDRVMLKQRGKDAFRKNYGTSVLVSFVFLLLTGTNVVQIQTNLENIGIYIPASVMTISGFAVWLLSVFVLEVLGVGMRRFFIENRDYNAPASKLFFGFNCGHYGNVVLTMFLVNIKTFLWSLLLFIPGIIKSYEYKMVPYILAEQPDINQSQAFAISRDMMMGNKSDAFILDLSFIGWNLLSGITCGLVGIFWSGPYELATGAELYATLRDNWMYRHNQTGPDLTGENF